MKFIKTIYLFLFSIIFLFIISCYQEEPFTLEVRSDLNYIIGIGEEVDFKQYFIIKDKKGNLITVTDKMLDLKNVKNDKEGSFKVILTYKSKQISATFTVINRVSTITSVSLVGEYVVYVGESITLEYETIPEGIKIATKYVSSNKDIAVVTDAGVVTGITAGDVEVVLLSGVWHDSIFITVLDKPGTLKELKILNIKDLEVEDTLELSYERIPATNTDVVKWETSDSSIATITKDGLLTALREGVVAITISSEKVTDSVFINITRSTKLKDFEITNSQDLDENDTLQLGFIITEGANVDYPFTWESSNRNILTITNDGLIRALKEGEATIYLTINDIVKEVVIKVSKKAPTINSIIILNHKELKVGEEISLKYTTTPSATGVIVTWQSSDPSVIGIDSNGKIKALKIGTSIIKASYQNIASEVKINVNPNPTDISNILSKYEKDWNFSILYTNFYKDDLVSKKEYFYDKINLSMKIYLGDLIYTDYLLYYEDKFYYCYQKDEYYIALEEGSQYYIDYTNSLDVFDLTSLIAHNFYLKDDFYYAFDTVSVCNSFFGFRDYSYNYFKLKIANEKIVSIETEYFYNNDLYKEYIVFDDYEKIKIDSSEIIKEDIELLIDLIIEGENSVYAEETIKLSFATYPAGLNVSPTWSVLEKEKAIIDQNGFLTALTDGVASVVIECNGIKIIKKITIKPARIKLEQIELIGYVDIFKGDSLLLSYITTPSDLDVDVFYTVSDTSIATVDEKGLLKSIKKGTIVITITSGDITDSKTINIIDMNEAILELTSKKNFALNYEIYQNATKIAQKTYVYDKLNLAINYTIDNKDFTDYLMYDQKTKLNYYLEQFNDTYKVIPENTNIYNDLLLKHLIFDFTILENCNYIIDNKTISLENNELLLLLFGLDDTFLIDSVSFTIRNNYINKIVLDCLKDNQNYRYILSFENYNIVHVDPSSAFENGYIQEDLVCEFTRPDYQTDPSSIGFTSESIPSAYDSAKGLIFRQANGEVILKSTEYIINITCVVVYVSTNANMTVSVKVNGLYLESDNQTKVSVSTSSYYTQAMIIFTSKAVLDGYVEIILTPESSTKDMYIKKICLSGTTQGAVSQVMPEQIYDEDKLDSSLLQDYLFKERDTIGLPATGSINVLVIPVQFTDTLITYEDLAKLRLSLNGTASDTGWESVASYYEKSSYGKLNLTFDVTDVFYASNTSSFYKNYKVTKNTILETGDEYLLNEALRYFDSSIDYSKYDTNGDSVIDAVYLIYQQEVDYYNNDFYWAYVSTYYTNDSSKNLYDGKYANYYLFAGFDFMNENTKNSNKGFEIIDGLKINAATYIHETAHLLGLDDYYDYYPGVGSEYGIGGADMMDYTVGDHNPYSKMMLGWVEPTVITTDSKITIPSFTSTGQFIMILLDYNNSYFSEYLLISLYTATDLNAMHSKVNNNYFYDGALYGAVIYHVSSDISNPFSDAYGSLTTNNNSLSDIPLIKMIQADGTDLFEQGRAQEDDLWQTGDIFSNVFDKYTRNDGKYLNFDIIFDKVTSSGLTITIDFY